MIISVLNLLYHSRTVLDSEHLRLCTELSCSARCIISDYIGENGEFPRVSSQCGKLFASLRIRIDVTEYNKLREAYFVVSESIVKVDRMLTKLIC